MGFYEDRRKTAHTLLVKYGQAMTLRDNTVNEVYDPLTGALTQGSPVSEDYPCRGIIYPITKGKNQDGGSVRSQRAILSAEGLSVVPSPSHQLLVMGRIYEILSVNPLEPAGVVVIYELSVAA